MSKHTEFPTKPDYEAKYKALEQAVKDAQSEMARYYSLKLGVRILAEKTGINA